MGQQWFALVWAFWFSQQPKWHARSFKPALIMFALLGLSQVWVAAQWLLGWSAHPAATFEYLMLGLAYMLFFIMLISLFNTRKRLSWLIGVLLVSGAFQAFWAHQWCYPASNGSLAFPKSII